MGLIQSLNRVFGAFKNNTLEGGGVTPGGSRENWGANYSGSRVTPTTEDFLGEWRAANSWKRFDMWRVRNRSRQLWNGNPRVKTFGRWLTNGVLGAMGIHHELDLLLPNGTDEDEATIQKISDFRKQLGKRGNFTTRKNLSRQDADYLLLRGLGCDGEIILRKRFGFENEFGFAWQIINPDYLDQNLNRMESGLDHNGKRVADPGNITKMSVELDKDDKFPVAYWFLHQRPNDYFYNYQQFWTQRYIRVPAEEIIHIFVPDSDNEEVRGWPWIFAAMVNLFREDKLAEAALINAAIGASKSMFYEKTFPDGFEGDPKELLGEYGDSGRIPDVVDPGSGVELPVGVTAKKVEYAYPNGEYDPFNSAILRGMAMCLGPSYASLTGDYTKSSFSASRMAEADPREYLMWLQGFFIREWKEPGFEEELYRGIISGKIALPITDYDRVIAASEFVGRRWDYIQPLDDANADQINLDNCSTSLSEIIGTRSQKNWRKVFRQIAKENALMKELGITRITSAKSTSVPEVEEETMPGTPNDPDNPESVPAPGKKVLKPAKK